jgi:hypothetical protein
VTSYRGLVDEFRAMDSPCVHESACATLVGAVAQMYLELGLWLAQTGRVSP